MNNYTVEKIYKRKQSQDREQVKNNPIQVEKFKNGIFAAVAHLQRKERDVKRALKTL